MENVNKPESGNLPESTGRKPSRKATNAIVSQRIEEVLKILLDGAQFHDIAGYASEKGWELSEKQLRNYMNRAGSLLVERQERKRPRLIAKHIAQRDALLARAINAADHRTALAIMADTAKLQGLYASDRDIKELVKSLVAQENRIKELEAQRDATPRDSGSTTPTSPATRPANSTATDQGQPPGSLPEEPRPAYG